MGQAESGDETLQRQVARLSIEVRRLQKENGELRVHLEGSQDALREVMGELREICSILQMADGDDMRSGIDLATIARLSIDLAEPMQNRIAEENHVLRRALEMAIPMITHDDRKKFIGIEVNNLIIQARQELEADDD